MKMAACGIVAVVLSVTALAADEGQIKEFSGDFQTGIYFKCGDSFSMAPMFMDMTKPAFIKTADDPVSDKLLKDICANGDDLKVAPAMARSLDKQQMFQGNRYGEVLHIAVFPGDGIGVGDKLKATARFKPGSLTTLAQVVGKYGSAPEKEAWVAKDFQTWVGLNGTVYWWGAVGVAGSADGTITHVLIREKEGVLDSKK